MTASAQPATCALPPEIVAAALRGWRLFPVRARDKRPPLVKDWPTVATCDLAQVAAWERDFPGCNWGLACGPESGVYVLDVDGEPGIKTVGAWAAKGWILPHTRQHITPRGHHLLYAWPSGFNFTISGGKLGPGIDERGDHGYILFPPSIHPSGHRYICTDEARPLAAMPEWLIALHERPTPSIAVPQGGAGQTVAIGQRTIEMTKDIGAMLRRKMPVAAIEAAALEINRVRNVPPLQESKVVQTVRDMARRYPAGQTVHGPDRHPSLAITREPEADTLNAHNALNAQPATPEQSETATLNAQPATWPILPGPALYGLVGDVVRAIEPHSEAAKEAILMQFLTAFGNVIDSSAHCRVEASRHALNLFCLLIGESSKSRKGTSWGHIRRLFSRVDDGWISDRVTSGLSSAEGLINEVRDEPDGTPTDRRLLIVQDEFASVLKIMSRDGNTLSPTLRSAWDSGYLRTLVKYNPLKATGAHISMIGHITRPELLKYLSETESMNGFANRLLFVCVKRSKCLPEGGTVSDEVMVELSRRIFDAVQWASSEPRELRRDEAARQLWAAVYPELSAGLPGLLGSATARGEAQVLRLSGIYAVLDKSATVRVEHLQAALSLWDYCFGSAKFIFGDATGDAVADRIREALEVAGDEGISRTGLRDIFKRHTSSDRIGQALTQLSSLGLAESFSVPTEGRWVEMWKAAQKAR